MGNAQPQTIRQVSPGAYILGGYIPGWTHTLHFRPGEPTIEIPWGWKFEAEIQLTETDVAIRIRSTSEAALFASLVFWIRPGAHLVEGDRDFGELKAGDHIPLSGAAPLRIACGKDVVEIEGLPAAAHRRFIFFPSSIPSAINSDCSALHLGLRFPVDISIKLRMNTEQLSNGFHRRRSRDGESEGTEISHRFGAAVR
jgi:hypothetical protein